MNLRSMRDAQLIGATLGATALSVVAMLVAAMLHARIGHSTPLSVLIAAGFLASLAGAIGGLLLAGRRQNVLWILALAVSMTALMGLLATVFSSLGTD